MCGYIYILIICTELSGKEPHRHAGLDRVIASGSLGHVMVCLLASEWQEVWVQIMLYARHDNESCIRPFTSTKDANLVI